MEGHRAKSLLKCLRISYCYRDTLFPIRGRLPLDVASVNWSKEVVDDEIGYVAAQPVPRGQIGSEMLTRENAAKSCFFRCGRKTCK